MLGIILSIQYMVDDYSLHSEPKEWSNVDMAAKRVNIDSVKQFKQVTHVHSF